MFNSLNPTPDFGPYHDLQKKMIQRVLAAKVDEEILRILQAAYEKELEERNVMLSRPERTRLFQQMVRAVLTDILDKLEK